MGLRGDPVVVKLADENYWNVERRWEGQTAFVLGSGPSLSSADVYLIQDYYTIAVNCSYLICPWADVLFFTDNVWFRERKSVVADWPGEVISLSRVAKTEMPDKVKRVKGDMRYGFAGLPPDTIFQGRSSGHSAIGLAVAMGANPVVLLGFDMRADPATGRTHCHDEYHNITERDKTVYERAFLPSFKGWDSYARAVGVDIYNATPDSALDEFRKIDLREVLSWRR